VAVEVRLVARDELARDDALVADLVDVVDEQEGVPVRKDPLDLADVEHARARRYFFLGAAAGAAGAVSEPSPAL
jgi:hypothetical protein